MKKEKKNIIILVSILILLILILKNNHEVKQNIITATELWATQVFPSLFPMFILSDLLIKYHFPEILANHLGSLFTKIYHTSSYGIFILIMSFLAGTPSSAFIIKDLNKAEKITEEEASYLLSFTFFSNPLFLLNILTLIFGNNNPLILKIMLCHYCTNLLIGLLLRPKEKSKFQKIPYIKENIPLSTILSISIKKALDTLLLILGTIAFYYVLANLIPINNSFINTIISGFCELTQGLNKILLLNHSETIKSILAVSFISFGGLSIHTQIKSILADTNISYLPFLKGRFLHVILSITLLILC